MQIDDNDIYPHLARFQMREQAKAERKRYDRVILDEFGRVGESEEGEEEQIYELERFAASHKI